MANPQPTDAHLRVAHSINEAIMMRDFTKRQRKILDLILRLSWGCGKKDAYIPRQRDFEAVGIGESHIKAELVWLSQSHIITIVGTNYSFNKDFDQWQISRVRPFAPEKLTKLVRLNLNGHHPELTETVSNNLPQREVPAYHNGKFPTPNLALPKERLKKVLKKRSSSLDKEKTTKDINLSEEIAEIATLYGDEIGKITSFVAQELNDAVQNYPAGWIKEAIKEAVKQNVRKWSHVKRILENWQQEDKGDRETVPSGTVSLKELISGQSIEKAIRIARGDTEASSRNKHLLQNELDKRGIEWRRLNG